jgi:uncharacterized membrane protein (UPF0127 family)
MKKLIAIVAILCCASLRSGDNKGARYWPLQIGDQFFPRIELALSEKEQQQGLMWRKTLDEEQGMLFVRQEAQIMSFWMKNTLVPLDIIFLDQDGVIVKIWQMPVEEQQRQGESLNDYEGRMPTYSSGKPASFALELKAGVSEVLQLKPGDKINLEIEKLKRLLEKRK